MTQNAFHCHLVAEKQDVASPESWLRLVWHQWEPARNRTSRCHPPGRGHTEGRGRSPLPPGCSAWEVMLAGIKAGILREEKHDFLPVTEKWRLRHRGGFALSYALHLPENPKHLQLVQKKRKLRKVNANVSITVSLMSCWPCPWCCTGVCCKPQSWEDVWTGPGFHGRAAFSASAHKHWTNVDLRWITSDQKQEEMLK